MATNPSSGSLERGSAASVRAADLFGCKRPTSNMTQTLRLLLLITAIATVALGGASRPTACGNNGGYSCAGIGAPMRAYGVTAFIPPRDAFDTVTSHVAG